MEVYLEAGLFNLPDGLSSTQGQVVFLRGRKQCFVLDWSSVKIRGKISSTLEAEAHLLKGTLDSEIYISSLLSEFISGDFKENKLKDEAFTDNKPVEQSIRSTEQVHEKLPRVDLGEVQRLLEEGEAQDVKLIPTKFQIVYSLTQRDVSINNLLELCQKTTIATRRLFTK